MKKKLVISCLFVLLFSCFVVFPVNKTQAQTFPSLVPSECLGEADLSECNLKVAEVTIGRVAQMILGITGSLALVMFVIGGVYYIFSSGESGKIKKANSIMSSAVIGIVIILMSGFAIKFILKALTTDDQLLSEAQQQSQSCLVKGPGYGCINITDVNDTAIKDYTCESNLCPGPAEIMCCKKIK